MHQYLIASEGLFHAQERRPQLQVATDGIQGAFKGGAGEGGEAEGAVDGYPQLPRQLEAQAILSGQFQCPLGHEDGVGDKHAAVVGFEVFSGEGQPLIQGAVVMAQLAYGFCQYPQVNARHQKQP